MAKEVAKESYKLEIIVKERKTSNGRKFTAYAVKNQKTGKWDTLKFTKEVPQSEIPTKHSYIYVKKDKVARDTRNTYPVIWVKEISSAEEIPVTPQDLTEFFEEC